MTRRFVLRTVLLTPRRAKRAATSCTLMSKAMEQKTEDCLKTGEGINGSNNHPRAQDLLDHVKENWNALQERLRNQVIIEDKEQWAQDFEKLKLVCGMDISFPKEDDSRGIACVVICSFPSLELVHQVTKETEVEEPYIPGYLAFREASPLLKVLEEILKERQDLKPNVILVDGNGILHPRKYGCACHIGVSTGIPTIGVAKNIYKMEDLDYDKEKAEAALVNPGDHVLIRHQGDVLGMALKTTKDAKNPVYVSVGHKISLESAKDVVLRCSKFRVPEPIRFADFNSREVLRSRDKIGAIKNRKE